MSLVNTTTDIRQRQELHGRRFRRCIGQCFLSSPASLGAATSQLALSPAEGLDRLPRDVGEADADDDEDREVLGEGGHLRLGPHEIWSHAMTTLNLRHNRAANDNAFFADHSLIDRLAAATFKQDRTDS